MDEARLIHMGEEFIVMISDSAMANKSWLLTGHQHFNLFSFSFQSLP